MDFLFLAHSAVFMISSFVQDPSSSESSVESDSKPHSISESMSGNAYHDGFIPFYWDESKGKVWLKNPPLGEEFIYVNYLATGLGSNPIGLDRGKLDRTRVVKFMQIGSKILLIQKNLDYRAMTESEPERRAVEESFAQSVLWGGVVTLCSDGILVDLSSFLLRDANNTVQSLKQQGEFSLDVSRSAIYAARLASFTANSEFEALLTFQAKNPAAEVRKTTPTPEAVTLRQHHSFVRLPDNDFKPREWHPRGGYFSLKFRDYATPIGEPVLKRLIHRHRLVIDEQGNVKEPITYYVDSGAPEPVRTALLDGARWWGEAFESAGLKNAFKVEILRADQDPLDIRVNVIQWVHRATRGWSYGSTVTDPRTGEIIKGHVTLGSLRVRQDRMLFEGVATSSRQTSCGQCGANPPAIAHLAGFDEQMTSTELALARIRQLAAHEVGHTLGLAHNFAASTYGRESVMDYPAPLIKVTPENRLDLSDAYGVGVGEWDKFTIAYGYKHPRHDETEGEFLSSLVANAGKRNLLFLTDADARPAEAIHPLANLWDNGSDPLSGLHQAMRVRRISMDSFGLSNLESGALQIELEDIFVPVYFHHRYQLDASVKLIGGAYYEHSIAEMESGTVTPVEPAKQRAAIDAILETIQSRELRIPSSLRRLMMPRPFWDEPWGVLKESMPRRTGLLFDPEAPAEIATRRTMALLLEPSRCARLCSLHSLDADYPDLRELIHKILNATWWRKVAAGEDTLIKMTVESAVLDAIISLAGNPKTSDVVRGIASEELRVLRHRLTEDAEETADSSHSHAARERIERFLTRPHQPFKSPSRKSLPPGSPIGTLR